METLDAAQRVVVVGGGATGCWAARTLTQAGAHALLLEAGSWPARTALPAIAPQAPLDAHEERARLRSTRAQRTTQRVQRGCYAFTPATAPLFVSDAAQPYALGDAAPYRWIRVRAVGGRTLVWNGIALRMLERDFDALRLDGAWPIGMPELERHYREAEAFFGLTGQQAHAPSASERHARRAIARRWPGRPVLSAPHFRSTAAQPEPAAAALPSFSCRDALGAAQGSGLLELRTDSVVSRLELDAGGRRIVAAEVVDARTCERLRVTGRAFVLCASALESTRILLNSACAQHPGGLGNASGLLGSCLSDHLVGVSALGARRVRDGRPSVGWPAAPYVTELYFPPFRDEASQDRAPDFAGTYGIQAYLEAPAAGARGGRCVLHAFGTVLARRENGVRIDPALRDALGVPALRIAARYGENEARMAADQSWALEQLMAALGYELMHRSTTPDVPGTSMHEVGTARMGRRREHAVLDPWNRVWGLDNLFVTDGACFVEMGAANPTLTMLAITGRACEQIGERLGAGAL